MSRLFKALALAAALLPGMASAAITRTSGPGFNETTAATGTTSTFNAGAGDLIVVTVGSNKKSTTTVCSWSGGTPAGATAFSRIGSNTCNASGGCAGTFAAIATSALTGVAVVAGDDGSGTSAAFVYAKVRIYSGAKTSGTVAAAFGAATNGTGSGAASLSPSVTATGSVLLAAFLDWNAVGTATARSGDTALVNYNSAADAWYVIEQTADTSATGATAIGATAPSAGLVWSGIAVEVLAASSGSTYSDSFSEAVTAGSALANAATWPNALTEPATAADSLTNAMVWANATTEMVAALDSLANSATWTQAMTEAVTAAAAYLDALSPAGGTTYSDAVTEALSALDALGHLQTMPNAVTEAIAAGDSLVAAHLMIEVATVAVAAAESLANAAIWAPTITEAANAQDAAFAQLDMANTILEHVNALDLVGEAGSLQQQLDALTARVKALEAALSSGGTLRTPGGGTLRTGVAR